MEEKNYYVVIVFREVDILFNFKNEMLAGQYKAI